MAVSNSVLKVGVVATAAIAQHQTVTLTGAVATAADFAVGFALTGAAIGARFPVTVLGTALGRAGAAIARGELVEVGAAGRVVTRDSGVRIGRSLTAASAAGETVELLLIPN